MSKHIAIYVRVSSKKQDHRSQMADLKRWAEGKAVKFYRDTYTGKTMDRPGWNKLWADVEGGKVSKVCCWRLDRLGRTAKGLTALFADLQERKVGLVSLKDGIDLGTAAGRMMANMLASVAQFETEIRAERVLAGQQAAREAGKTWGGRKEGTRIRLTEEKQRTIRAMRESGETIAAIARTVGLSRPTIYSAL